MVFTKSATGWGPSRQACRPPTAHDKECAKRQQHGHGSHRKQRSSARLGLLRIGSAFNVGAVSASFSSITISVRVRACATRASPCSVTVRTVAANR